MPAERRRKAHKPRKPKLLFDEGLPPRQSLPNLSRNFDVKHIEHDFRKGGSGDPAVYELANGLGRILVTFNIKHFKPRVTPTGMSVLGLGPRLTYEQMDKKLVSIVKNVKEAQFHGQYIPVTGETGKPKRG